MKTSSPTIRIDVRGISCMPLDVSRLLTSNTWLAAGDDPIIGYAQMTLWMRAWHQVPAGSLPSDDALLARLAMCEREIWPEIKSIVLADWTHESDDRYYHPVIAKLAYEADEKRTAAQVFSAKQKIKSAAGVAARKANQARPKAAKSLPVATEIEVIQTPSTVVVDLPIAYSAGTLVSKKLNDAQEVFDHWVAVFKKSGRTVFDAARQKKINARLKEGYSVNDLNLAIDGCSMRPHNNGGTNGTVYNQIDLIFRDADHVESYISTARGQKDLFVAAASQLSKASQQSMSALDEVFGGSSDQPLFLKDVDHE